MNCKTYMMTAKQESGQTYRFEAIALPTGEAVVPHSGTNDVWYETIDDVQLRGTDTIIGCELKGETDWPEADVISSVTSSAREFGKDAVPKTLHRYIQLDK